MITSFSSPKTKIPLSSNSTKNINKNGNNGNMNINDNKISTNININKFKNYKDATNLLTLNNPSINKSNKNDEKVKEKENINYNNNEDINQNETLSNIIDAINENNLNAFYEDDSSNFKRNIDQLNLKFYLETEKIIKSSNDNNEACFNSNTLFLILFKQINLYISEIERLNVIILDSKRDPHSISKKLSVMNRQKSDFEIKEQIIKTLKFSVSSLEKQLAEVLKSENTLRQENKKLKEDNKFYLDYYIKHNNKENKNNNNSKVLINRYNNIYLNNSNSNNKINTSNNYIFKYNTNTSYNNINITYGYNHSSNKDIKSKKHQNTKNNKNSHSNNKNTNDNTNKNNNNNNNNNNNKENGSTKKNELILLAKHRRTYSAQNEEMINSLNKKIEHISQGIIKHTNTKTNRLNKQENYKNPTKILNKNINSPCRNNEGINPVGNNKNNNNKILQSVKDGMREKYLNRKKKNIMNINHSNINKLELILNKDAEGSFMKYKSQLYGNSPQYQNTTSGTIKQEDNFTFFNKINTNFDNSCNINYNAKYFKKNNDNNDNNNALNELDILENLITEVRDYLIDNNNGSKNKINEYKIYNNNNNDNKSKLKECKTMNSSNIGPIQNVIKNISFKNWSSKKE